MRWVRYGIVAGVLAIADVRPARGQTECGAPSGPDVIIGNIDAVANVASSADVEAFALGYTLCNVGGVWLNFMAGTPQHPVIGQNLFRLRSVDGAARFEHIGQSWLHHEFFALSSTFCCSDCQATNGAHLGVRCSSPTSASSQGSQSGAGPKYQINAATGAFPYPPANPPFTGSVARRLQAKISDLDPQQNGGGAYFVELQVVAADDAAAGHDDNNASYRPCVIAGTGTAWNMALAGTTQRERAGIRAWKDSDPGVIESTIDVPGDGRFILAAEATNLGGGVWRYEYAVQNLNSDRSGQSFAVPLPSVINITNIGFHDVDYHSGDGGGNVNFDGADWPAAIANGAITWSTQAFAENPNANALRWGTLYNVRFDADVPPTIGTITLALFKPGAPATATAVTVVPAQVPGDADGDGDADLTDFAALVACLTGPDTGPIGAGCTVFDLKRDNDVDLCDVGGFMTAFTGE